MRYNEKRKAEAGKRKERREDELNDLRAVLVSPEGRRFVWRLLERGGVFRSSFCAESDSCTAFNEGRRNLGLSVLNDVLEADSGSFRMMQDEARRRA